VLTGLNSNDWAASLRRDEHVNRRTALRRGEEHYGFIVFESCAMSVMVVTHTRRGWTFSERQISIYSTGVQLLSGSNSVIALATSLVFFPKSF